ncbi:MAG: hypothetical protein J6P72_03720 [Firmicutes bacterium]|nr:hypothetical protein [Bacillota bacterium]
MKKRIFSLVLALCLCLSASGCKSSTSKPELSQASGNKFESSELSNPAETSKPAEESKPAETQTEAASEPESQKYRYAFMGLEAMPQCPYLDALSSFHYYLITDIYENGTVTEQIQALDGVTSYTKNGAMRTYSIDGHYLIIDDISYTYFEMEADPSAVEENKKTIEEIKANGTPVLVKREFRGTGKGTVPLLFEAGDTNDYEYYEFFNDKSIDSMTFQNTERYFMKDGDVFAIWTKKLSSTNESESTVLIREISQDIPEGMFDIPDLTGYEDSNAADVVIVEQGSVSAELNEYGGTVACEHGVSVDVTPWLGLPEGTPVTVSKAETVTDEEMGADYTVYEISMGEIHELGGYVSIRIPYDGKNIEAGQDPAGCVAGMYLNPETGEWEGVPYEVDTSAKELIIHTDHFSTYGCFEFVNEGKRMAKVTKINEWMIIADNDQVMEAVKEILENNGTPGEACREVMRPALEESFNALAAINGATADQATVVGNLTTLFISGTGLGDIVGNSEWANSLTTALGYAGIATSIASLSVTALKADKTNNEIIGMYKDAVYLLGSLSQSATLGTIGASVWLIDKGLMDMGNYAYDKIAEDTTKAYRRYYSKYMTRTKAEWRWALKDIAWAAIKDKEGVDTAVMKEIDRWCNLFWSIDTNTYTNILIDVGQSGRGWPDAATKEAITNDYKRDLIRLLEPVFEEVQQDMQWKLEEEQEKAVNKVKNLLNSTLTFEFIEEMQEGQEEAKYSGYTAVFSPLPSGMDKKDWQITLSKSGSTTVKTTLIGYLLAGRPMEVKLFEPGKDPGKDEPEMTIPFSYTAPKTVISLSGDEISGLYDMSITITDWPPQEHEAYVTLGKDGAMDISIPMTMADTASVLSDGPTTYINGTAHIKGIYDQKTHAFTGTLTSDLPDLLYEDATVTLTFDTDAKPIIVSGEILIHAELMGYTYDDTAQVAMKKK